KNSGRRLYESKMIDNDGFFTFDYKDIEKKFKTGRIKMFMLCSPHNPLGRVFKKGELEELFELCRKYNVLICADEVHCDLIMPDQEFLPAYSFSKYRNRMVTITAAAKTFSLALFSHCHIIIADPKLRKRFIAYQQKAHKGSVNVFNALPTYYSYQFGEEWLDAFNNVVFENYSYIRKELGKDLEICTLEGSYLLFINLEGYCQGKTAFDTLVKDCSIVANAGETFAKGYESWARLNLATSLKNIRKAVRNIKKLIKEKQQ
ncbi:MAG: aminotransferase class I/II-fold pyridoxal phosphate-dependent enzyme, partial [Erysipelotrichaceae bacterium]|nr:aminotransferase class I/II-fold pyridoxal phosphate-dependent enzyme [Erysipelotrichaceae bacterium]